MAIPGRVRRRSAVVGVAFLLLAGVGLETERATATLPPVGAGGGSQRVGADDMYIQFSVGGAQITPQLDGNGNPTGNYVGEVTGDKITVSGTAHFQMGAGLITYLAFDGSVATGDVRAGHHFPKDAPSKTVEGGKSGITIDEAFSFEITVPPVAPRPIISLSWRNCGDWVCGGPTVAITLNGPKPLCDEAAGLFNLPADKRSLLRKDLADLQGDLEAAIAASKVKLRVSASKIPPIDTAWSWLFPNGFPTDAKSIERWSFTDPSKVKTIPIGRLPTTSEPGGLYHPDTPLPEGAGEARLAQAIAAAATKSGTKQTPGQVLALALAQTAGDARRASLLAHNTLKALGRGGGEHAFGLGQDTSYFNKYLMEFRHDPDPKNANDNTVRNAGEWYHLFGTMHFRLEVADGVNWWSDMIVRGGTSVASYLAVPAAVASAKLTVPLVLIGGGASMAHPKLTRAREMLMNLAGKGLWPGGLGYAEYANWAEQVYREMIDGSAKDPDPEKYCINVWGANLADLLWRLANPEKPFQIFDDTRTNPYSNIAGDTASINGPPPNIDPNDLTGPLPTITLQSPTVDPSTTGPGGASNLRILGIHSPLDAVIEVGGETLILDQKNGYLIGNPVRPVHAVPEGDGTYTLGLMALASEPVKITMFGSDKGTAHVIDIDTATGQMTTWEQKVKGGTKLTLDLTDPQKALTEALTRDDGSAVRPRQVSLESGPGQRFGRIAGMIVLVLAGIGMLFGLDRFRPWRASTGPGLVRRAVASLSAFAAAGLGVAALVLLVTTWSG